MMLPCAIPKTSEARVPSSLLRIYVQYKQDTRAVIAWLISHGTNRYRRLRTLSIKDLFGLAQIVQTKGVEMPDTIEFHFREAIAARTQLTKFFRQRSSNREGIEEEETLNHEHFTTSLAKIYANLCECCARPQRQCEQAHQRVLSSESIPSLPNRFTALRHECTDHGCSSDEETQQCPCELGVTSKQPKAMQKDLPSYGLSDDTLGEAFEFLKELQEMNDLLMAAESAWEEAAQGEASILVASLVTNTIYAAFEGIENRLKFFGNVCDPAALQSKLTLLEQDLGLSVGDAENLRSPIRELIENLQTPWRKLLTIKGEGPAKQRQKESSTVHLPSQLVLRKGANAISTDDECLGVMLQNIIQHIQSGYLHNDILRLGTPVYAEVGYFLAHDGIHGNGLRCSYGTQLLLASYKAYLFALKERSGNPSCRLQALQFAQEIIPSISMVLDDSTMPCRCQGTLAYHLENLREDFKGFLNVNRFDFYFQSPWVCGCHMLEMSEALFYYGLRLFSYRNYVGSVIHVYNVLRQFTDLEPVPLLEKLCEACVEPLFPGGRPNQNFKACYIRFMGGRLRFNSQASDHKSGCHSMAIPAHTARATAGFGSRSQAHDPRFDYRKMSLFYHIKERCQNIRTPVPD